MFKTQYDLADQDKQLGYQKVNDQESLLQDVISAGYNIAGVGSFNLKPVSQKQMKDWSQELIRAIFEINWEQSLDICSNRYVVFIK